MRVHRIIFILIACIALVAVSRDIWLRHIAYNPTDYNLPPYAREMVRLRTDTTVTFHLQGRKYVTMGRAGYAVDGGPVQPEDGTGSSL